MENAIQLKPKHLNADLETEETMEENESWSNKLVEMIEKEEVFFLMDGIGKTIPEDTKDSGQRTLVYSPQKKQLINTRKIDLNREQFPSLDIGPEVMQGEGVYLNPELFRLFWKTFDNKEFPSHKIELESKIYLVRIDFKAYEKNKITDISTGRDGVHLSFALQVPTKNKEIVELMKKKDTETRDILWKTFVKMTKKYANKDYLDFFYEQFKIYLELEKDITIVGFDKEKQDIDHPENRKARKIIEKSIRDGRGRQKEEKDKTEKEHEMIANVNEWIENEVISLGISNSRETLNPNRVHLFEKAPNLIRSSGISSINPTKRMIKLVRPETQSFFEKVKNNIESILKKELSPKYNIYTQLQSLLHEAIHYYGHIKYQHNKKEDSLSIYRFGYQITNDLGKEKEHEHFTGFNEGITEKITLDILEKNKNLIKTKLKISEKEIREGSTSSQVSSYKINLGILEKILEKVSEKEKRHKEEVWENIKKGYFTGDMMHLRSIEKVFGPKALRILSDWGNIKDNYIKSVYVFNFFNVDTEKEREDAYKAFVGK